MTDVKNTNELHIPTMLTISEVIEKTGLSYYFLWNGCRAGDIVHIKSGNKYLINFDKLLERMNGEDGKND